MQANLNVTIFLVIVKNCFSEPNPNLMVYYFCCCCLKPNFVKV